MVLSRWVHVPLMTAERNSRFGRFGDHKNLLLLPSCLGCSPTRRVNKFSTIILPVSTITNLWDHRLPPQLNWILPYSGWLRGVRWFEMGVSGLSVDPIFKGQVVEEEGGRIDPWRYDRYVVPKRRFQTILRRTVTQNVEELSNLCCPLLFLVLSLPFPPHCLLQLLICTVTVSFRSCRSHCALLVV
jgi:hypothetical protein